MTNDPIFDQVAKTASETLMVDLTAIDVDTPIESLGATSLDIVTIAMDLEDVYDTEMFADDNQQFITIGDIVEHVRSCLKESA